LGADCLPISYIALSLLGWYPGFFFWYFCCLIILVSYHTHQHHCFPNLRLRLTKTGTTTKDVMTVRLLSFFTQMSAKDEAEVGQLAWVHCRSEHLNCSQLFHALLLFACSAPGVGMSVPTLLQQPRFPSLLVRSLTGAVRLFKRRSKTEINTRFVSDLARIGQDFINGERSCRLYSF